MFISQTLTIILFFTFIFVEIILVFSIGCRKKDNQKVESVLTVLLVVNTIILSFLLYLLIQFNTGYRMFEPILK